MKLSMFVATLILGFTYGLVAIDNFGDFIIGMGLMVTASLCGYYIGIEEQVK